MPAGGASGVLDAQGAGACWVASDCAVGAAIAATMPQRRERRRRERRRRERRERRRDGWRRVAGSCSSRQRCASWLHVRAANKQEQEREQQGPLSQFSCKETATARCAELPALHSGRASGSITEAAAASVSVCKWERRRTLQRGSSSSAKRSVAGAIGGRSSSGSASQHPSGAARSTPALMQQQQQQQRRRQQQQLHSLHAAAAPVLAAARARRQARRAPAPASRVQPCSPCLCCLLFVVPVVCRRPT